MQGFLESMTVQSRQCFWHILDEFYTEVWTLRIEPHDHGFGKFWLH